MGTVFYFQAIIKSGKALLSPVLLSADPIPNQNGLVAYIGLSIWFTDCFW